jgi:hypothetical protein
MSFRRFIAVTLIAGIFFGSVFWLLQGRNLHINVYIGDEYLYSEEFTDTGKVVVTLVASSVSGFVVASIHNLCMRRYVRNINEKF